MKIDLSHGVGKIVGILHAEIVFDNRGPGALARDDDIPRIDCRAVSAGNKQQIKRFIQHRSSSQVQHGPIGSQCIVERGKNCVFMFLLEERLRQII